MVDITKLAEDLYFSNREQLALGLELPEAMTEFRKKLSATTDLREIRELWESTPTGTTARKLAKERLEEEAREHIARATTWEERCAVWRQTLANSPISETIFSELLEAAISDAQFKMLRDGTSHDHVLRVYEKMIERATCKEELDRVVEDFENNEEITEKDISELEGGLTGKMIEHFTSKEELDRVKEELNRVVADIDRNGKLSEEDISKLERFAGARLVSFFVLKFADAKTHREALELYYALGPIDYCDEYRAPAFWYAHECLLRLSSTKEQVRAVLDSHHIVSPGEDWNDMSWTILKKLATFY